MHLLQCLWFFCSYFDVKIAASHIPGIINAAADKLSRNHLKDFLPSNPGVSRLPVWIPTPLLEDYISQENGVDFSRPPTTLQTYHK